MAPSTSGLLDSPTAKVLAVLEAVARLGNAPVSILAETIGLPIPTAYRICTELERLGHLQRVPGSRNWTVAGPLVEMAANVLASASETLPALGVLSRLTHEIGEMASFAVQAEDKVLYVASAEAPQELTLSFRAGRKAPLFCTSSGRLFLSRMTDDALRHYLHQSALPALTPFTTTDPDKLLAIIQKVRAQGYALTSQEYMLHVVGAAVPVLSESGQFFGALSVAAPDFRMSTARLRKLVPELIEASRSFGAALTRRRDQQPVA